MSNKINITEQTTDLIIDHVSTNIKAKLDEVVSYRGDLSFSIDAPQSYFIYESAIDLKCPALYVIADSVDTQLQRGQNHLNAQIKYTLSIVFEYKDAEKCVRGLYRYVDALYRLLNLTQLDSSDSRARNVIKVVAIDYSGLQQNKDQEQNIFRKEAMLTLMVEHFETETD